MMNKESYFQHLFFDRLYIAKKLGLNTEFLLKYWESTKITNDINEVIEICKAFDIGIDEYFASEVDAANFEAKLSANTRKYLSLRKDENCKGAVFYLGELTASINGIDYVSWKDWGDWIEKS